MVVIKSGKGKDVYIYQKTRLSNEIAKLKEELKTLEQKHKDGLLEDINHPIYADKDFHEFEETIKRLKKPRVFRHVVGDDPLSSLMNVKYFLSFRSGYDRTPYCEITSLKFNVKAKSATILNSSIFSGSYEEIIYLLTNVSPEFRKNYKAFQDELDRLESFIDLLTKKYKIEEGFFISIYE